MLGYSCVTLFYLYLIGKKFFNPLVTYLTLIILVTTVPFYNFAVQVRGYGLSVTFITMIIYHVWNFEKYGRWKDMICFIVFSILSLYTVPSNLYIVGSIMLWYLSIGTYKYVKKTHAPRNCYKQHVYLIISAGFFISLLIRSRELPVWGGSRPIPRTGSPWRHRQSPLSPTDNCFSGRL